MSKAVVSAFAERRPLLIEAPTGTGKTLAYLVPAVAWARATGRPVILSTHSKVLQNQVLTSGSDPFCGAIEAFRPQFQEAGSGEPPRRRITDPGILEKRRAALEKARRALAKKRAAAKKAG